jgi:branched-chain amino acid transport system substrate-binding protein
MKDKPDAVFIIAVGTTSALPHIALVERGYKGKVYHTGAVANADFLRVRGKSR